MTNNNDENLTNKELTIVQNNENLTSKELTTVRNRTNIYVTTQTKGGVGKTTISMVLATLLYKKNRIINVYEIDDNNSTVTRSNILNFKSIQIKESEELIDEVSFDSFSEDENVINVVDCGGGSDTLAILNQFAQNGMTNNNYFIPIFDDIDHIENAIDTISRIKAFDENGIINLLFNRCFSLEEEKIREQFIAVFGSVEYDIESRVEDLHYDNIYFIPNTNIFSILKLKKISLLDTYKEAIDLIDNLKKYQKKWQREGRNTYLKNMKMIRLGKDVIQLIEDVKHLKKSLS